MWPRLIADHAPEEIAVENPFFARNARTALILGQVRGAVLVSVAEAGLPLFEYAALEIKKAVTGYGQAEKNQVGVMIRALLRIEDESMEEDAADALACALCHLNTRLFQKNVESSVRVNPRFSAPAARAADPGSSGNRLPGGQTAKRKLMMSPSRTGYSFPSSRSDPSDLQSWMFPLPAKSS